LLRAVLIGLGHKPTADLDIRTVTVEGSGTKTTSNLVVRNSLEADLLIQISGYDPSDDPAQLMLKAASMSIAPGHVSLNSLSFGDRFLSALSTAMFEGQEAKAVLKEGLGDFLAALADPKDPQNLNQGILALELNQLIDAPKSLTLNWSPQPGFPQSVLAKGDGSLIAALSELAKGNTGMLAEKYKYDILKNLNLSLEVNGRAPVSVYLVP
jgi:hypothetical protein